MELTDTPLGSVKCACIMCELRRKMWEEELKEQERIRAERIQKRKEEEEEIRRLDNGLREQQRIREECTSKIKEERAKRNVCKDKLKKLQKILDGCNVKIKREKKALQKVLEGYQKGGYGKPLQHQQQPSSAQPMANRPSSNIKLPIDNQPFGALYRKAPMFGIGILFFLSILLPPVSAQCSTCLGGRCFDTGKCVLGCVPGYFNEYCSEACPSNCLNKTCLVDKHSGTVTCTDGCKQGYCGELVEGPANFSLIVFLLSCAIVIVLVYGVVGLVLYVRSEKKSLKKSFDIKQDGTYADCERTDEQLNLI